MGTCRESQKDEVRVVLVGKAGSGKSSLGNTLLGTDVFPVGNSFGRVPSGAQEDCQSGQFGLQVVDTPGFFDTELQEANVAASVVRAISCLLPRGPDAVLLVVKAHRFTEEDFRTYNRLKALFDSEISQRVIVVFTGGDYLEKENVSIEECIRNGPDPLRDLLEEVEQRYVVINNKAAMKRPQAEKLLSAIHTLKERHKGKTLLTPYPHHTSPTSPHDDMTEQLIHMTEQLIHRRLHSLKESELREEHRLHLEERSRTAERQ